MNQQTYGRSGRSRDPDDRDVPSGEGMEVTLARSIAYAGHLQSRDRFGELIIEHVARVAAAVPPEAETTAWLHDLLEKTPTTLVALRERRLSIVDCEALSLLTRAEDESYELHVLRIAHAHGAAGRRARTVKLADLDDHLARSWASGDPPYGWARHHVSSAAARMDAARAGTPVTGVA